MKYGLEFAGVKKRVRRDWGATVLTVVTLLAVAALCGWLCSCVGSASGQPWRLGDMEAVLVLTVGSFVLLLGWAVAAVRKNELWIMALREDRRLKAADPLAEVTDGLDCDEMHRILVSVAAEAREIRRLVSWATNHQVYDAATSKLEDATGRMHALIGCVDALCERLQPEISEKEVMP